MCLLRQQGVIARAYCTAPSSLHAGKKSGDSPVSHDVTGPSGGVSECGQADQVETRFLFYGSAIVKRCCICKIQHRDIDWHRALIRTDLLLRLNRIVPDIPRMNASTKGKSALPSGF